MSLLIIESPNKIKKLTKILGNNFVVMATVGHFMLLSKKELGFDKKTFEPNYIMDKDKTTIINKIIKEAKKHDDIFIATDPDREGEAIAKHIYDKLPKKGKTIKRVKFNAITKEAVKKAMKNCGDIDLDLYRSQTARRITDRIVGYKVSPVMWKKGMAKTSAGRVQSVALKILSDREKQIQAFVPEEYWKISILFKNKITSLLEKKDSEKLERLNKADAVAIEKDLKTSTYTVNKVTSKKRNLKTKPPFITSTLQQDASNKFNWPSKKTMNVAQTLFGHGLITYHRTDSIRVEDSKINDVRTKIDSMYGKNYLSKTKNVWKNADASQDAHEAIRPTYEQAFASLSSDEKKLLSLITNRFMASQMADAEIEKTTYEILASGTSKYILKTSGDVISFDGFLKVYGDKKSDAVLPKVTKGQSLNLDSVKNEKNMTKAPSRYTDASIIQILEKEGVGRPSTYASIIETLEKRKYITRKAKSLCASDVGIMISDYLSEHFNDLVDAEFTKNMEEALDKISVGSLEYIKVMNVFYNKILKDTEDAITKDLPKAFHVDTECPKCSTKMIKKISKYGPFLACQAWPKCDGIRNIKGEDLEVSNETGKPCPKCNNILVLRSGSSGKFYGCKSFPICKHTEIFAEEGEEREVIKCKKCDDGEMLKRKGRYGFFLGCSNYPKCKTIVNIKNK